MTTLCRSLLVAYAALLLAPPAAAQGDLEGARASLAGVAAFGVDATVEGPPALTSSDELRPEALIRAAQARLRETDLPRGARSESAPTLHVHLNMMQVPNGLIAFSVELDFFQDVRLVRNRQTVSAVTWNESIVGLVSHDMTSTIAESVLGLIDQFAQDFRTIN